MADGTVSISGREFCVLGGDGTILDVWMRQLKRGRQWVGQLFNTLFNALYRKRTKKPSESGASTPTISPLTVRRMKNDVVVLLQDMLYYSYSFLNVPLLVTVFLCI